MGAHRSARTNLSTGAELASPSRDPDLRACDRPQNPGGLAWTQPPSSPLSQPALTIVGLHRSALTCLDAGVILQEGSSKEVVDRPQTARVAEIVGSKHVSNDAATGVDPSPGPRAGATLDSKGDLWT